MRIPSVALGVTMAALLSGCVASNPSSTPSAAPTGGSTPMPTAVATTGPSPTPTATAIAPCSLITEQEAGAYIGGAPTSQKPYPTNQPTGVTLKAGCTYQNGKNVLAYGILEVGADAAKGEISAFQKAMRSVHGNTPFTVALGDSSYGSTSAFGGSTIAQLEVAKGTAFIRVDVINPSADAARAAALAVAQKLLAATS